MNDQAEHERVGIASLGEELRSLAEVLERVDALALELGYSSIARWARDTREAAQDYLNRNISPSRGGGSKS